MKLNKLVSAIALLSFLVGAIGVTPTHALGTPQIVSVDPSSPQPVGTCIKVKVKIDGSSDYGSMHVRLANEGWQESSELQFERTFCTDNYGPGNYTIRVEARSNTDNSWSSPTSNEVEYQLTAPQPPPGPSKGPNISVFNLSPDGGAKVGDSVNIHIRVNSSNPGATKINVSCGGVSKIETPEVEFDSTWNTSGCPAGTAKVEAYSRAVDDPNWTNSSYSSGSYSLSESQSDAPSANFSADDKSIQKGQCTNLHWQTGKADNVDIDGNNVANSGDMQVCPTVTEKYTLSAHNQSGTANRNITILVSDQSSSGSVADSFRTGNIINIGGDIYVIVDGTRMHIPNPDTLDALGISRDQIDNKGFSSGDLRTIPQGVDIPDVDMDCQGFLAFKNQYFPNTAPIGGDHGCLPGAFPPNAPNSPSNEPTSSGWRVGARVGLCAGAAIRSGSGFGYAVDTYVPADNWAVDIIDGPRQANGVTWWDVSRKNLDGGGTGWVYLEQAGSCDGSIPSKQKPSPENGDGQSPSSAYPPAQQPAPGQQRSGDQQSSGAPSVIFDLPGIAEPITHSKLLQVLDPAMMLINAPKCYQSQDILSESCGDFSLNAASTVALLIPGAPEGIVLGLAGIAATKDTYDFLVNMHVITK